MNASWSENSLLRNKDSWFFGISNSHRNTKINRISRKRLPWLGSTSFCMSPGMKTRTDVTHADVSMVTQYSWSHPCRAFDAHIFRNKQKQQKNYTRPPTYVLTIALIAFDITPIVSHKVTICGAFVEFSLLRMFSFDILAKTENDLRMHNFPFAFIWMPEQSSRIFATTKTFPHSLQSSRVALRMLVVDICGKWKQKRNKCTTGIGDCRALDILLGNTFHLARSQIIWLFCSVFCVCECVLFYGMKS